MTPRGRGLAGSVRKTNRVGVPPRRIAPVVWLQHPSLTPSMLISLGLQRTASCTVQTQILWDGCWSIHFIRIFKILVEIATILPSIIAAYDFEFLVCICYDECMNIFSVCLRRMG